MSTLTRQSTLADKIGEMGVRLTKQRRFLIDLIESSQTHLHPSDILKLARQRGEKMDRTTVYRTLGMLKEMGLIEELDLLHLSGHEHYYELRDKNKRHIHLGCVKCGKILEFRSRLIEQLESEIRKETGYDVLSMRIEVAAICRKCRGENGDE